MPDTITVPRLWEVSSNQGLMLVQAKSMRAASQVAAWNLAEGILAPGCEHVHVKLVRVTQENPSGVMHFQYEITAVGVPETALHLSVQRPEVFV